MREAATLFEDGCEDEEHTWSDPDIIEHPERRTILVGRTCLLCGLTSIRVV